MHDDCYAAVVSYHDTKKLREFFEANYPKESYGFQEDSLRVTFWVQFLCKSLLEEFAKFSESLRGCLHIMASDSSVSETDRHYVFFDGKCVGGWMDNMFEIEEDVDDAI